MSFAGWVENTSCDDMVLDFLGLCQYATGAPVDMLPLVPPLTLTLPPTPADSEIDLGGPVSAMESCGPPQAGVRVKASMDCVCC